MELELDYLALAAHPDDAELYCGGTLIKMREKGYGVGVLDLTQGEAGTLGSIEERKDETRNANKILKLAFRDNLELPDMQLQDDMETRRLIINIIRQYKVKIMIAPLGPCRHPDHTAVYQLANSTFFFSGAGKFPSDYPPWRPLKLIYHLEYNDRNPSFVIDISTQFKDKMRAIEAYTTQFYNAANKEEKTLVASKRFREFMISRLQYYGNLVGSDYGEPFFAEGVLRMDDPLKNILGQ